MSLPERLLKIATKKGYHKVWEQYVGEGMSHEQAYKEVEDEYREHFDGTMYKNYESFRVSRYYYVNNTIKNN